MIGAISRMQMKLWWWFHISRHLTLENVAWQLAWLLPRKVALFAFVRVYSASGDNPDDVTYDSAYKAWAAGAGR